MNIFEELKKAPKVDINEVSYGRGKKIHPDSYYENIRMKAFKRGKIVDGKNMREWAEHYGIHATAMRHFYRMNGHVRYTRKTTGRVAKKIEGKTIPEWAEHYGLSGPAIRRRIDRNGHPHPKKG